MTAWLATARIAICAIVLAVCWGADHAINTHGSRWRGSVPLAIVACGTTGAIWAVMHHG